MDACSPCGYTSGMTNKKCGSNTRVSVLVRNGCGAAVLAAAFLLAGCALFGGGIAKATLSASPLLPAAEGSVKYTVTQNDNTRIVLTVRHLANPGNLTPPASTYVVWTRATKGATAQSIGAMKVDKDLNGELDAETPLHSFEMFLTAEGSGQAQQPSEQVVLWTNYSR